MKNSVVFLLLLTSIYGSFSEVHYRRIVQRKYDCVLTEETVLKKYKGFETEDDREVKIRTRPSTHIPANTGLKSKSESGNILEIWGKNDKIVKAQMETMCKRVRKLSPLEVPEGKQGPEVVKIVDGGDQSNRIDVVFMGDGYTLEERDEFFDDMRRLTSDMFEGATFKSYLPLFNIWAIFVPSQVSGIGYDGPINTPFRLYREQGQLRVIWPGNETYARQVCQLTGPSGCDYPSLIANDDFYGGLGGEFVISTRSPQTGTTVLRHEMGHNFVAAGDEYDNSWAYFGVNHAENLNSVGWTAWLTNGPSVREEKAMYRLLEYPWFDLSGGNQSFTFTTDGSYSRYFLLVSVSAAGEDDCLEFTLDGEVLPWTSRGSDDREFYEWVGETGFTPGQHVFTVRTKTMPTNPNIPRMICHINLHELGSQAEYDMDNSVVSAYPTWDDKRTKGLRPTSGGCLMRNMTHSEFCPVCKEGMWHQFLAKISLIDDLDIVRNPNPDAPSTVTVETLQLGRLRDPENIIEGERLEIRWFHRGEEQVDYRDRFTISALAGPWEVQVNLVTPEVRTDPQNLLQDRQPFTI